MVNVRSNQFVCLDDTNSEFVMTDGVVVARRAALYIGPECPKNISLIITNAVNNGWLKPIAFMKESEYLIAKLSNDE